MNKKLKFIDLFSGIGGFRLAFESLGCECAFSSDIDKWANETYKTNFNEIPSGDIHKIKSKDIPDHDILCGGFPCQPFSIAGRRLGFADTRGTLFFEIERILKEKKPKAFLLENVRGLLSHDGGNTFSTIKTTLNNLGYNIFYKILNSKDYGVPQNRERLLIVGFRDKVDKFNFPEAIPLKKMVWDILEENVSGHEVSEKAREHLEKHYANWIKKQNGNIPKMVIATEIRPSRCIIKSDGISPCLTAKMGTGGNNVPVLIKGMRKLTTRECLRLQGFPDTFKIKENNSQSYKQIGNSVTVPLITSVAKNMISKL